MSKVAELAYDIEQMYIEGYSPKTIAAILSCPIEIVYDWMAGQNLSEPVPDDEYADWYNDQ